MTANLHHSDLCPIVTAIGFGPRYTIAELKAALPLKTQAQRAQQANAPLMTPLGRSLLTARQSPENPESVQTLKDALAVIPADVGRGNGSILDTSGTPSSDYWLGVVWAIAGLGWTAGKGIAEDWSRGSLRYDPQGFATAWNTFNPLHQSPTGIGSVYKLAKTLGWKPTTPAAPGNTAKTYKRLSRADIQALPPTAWRVKGLLPQTGVAAIYGPSGSGKSFLAFDMALSLAMGTHWFQHRTVACEVTYVMLEGEGGLQKRLDAWELENKAQTPPTFAVIIAPFRLTALEDVDALASALPHRGVAVIDTLNRAAPDVDENSSQDMGRVLQGVKELQRRTDGLVLLVHHSGKDLSRGIRGHSSLLAALDGAVEVEHAGEERSWKAVKVKDGEDGHRHPFRLTRHVLGLDGDGEEISSCTVQPGAGASVLFTKKPPSGKHQKTALCTAKQAIRGHNTPGPPCTGGKLSMKVQDVVAAVAAALPVALANRRTNMATRLIGELESSGHLGGGTDANGEGWVWVA
jgi:hypothetical protein